MFGLMGVARGAGQPGGAAAFDPLSLFASGEKGGWYDPSDLSTMFQDTAGTTPVTATGQSVARINDKSGNGNHATQATAASRPTLQQDGNGNYYLQFAGTNDWLATANVDLTGTDKMTVLFGFQLDTVASFNGLYDFNGGGVGGNIAYSSTTSFMHSTRGATGTTTRSIASAMAINTPYVLTHRCDLSESLAFVSTRARINSATLGGTSTSAGPTGGGNYANGALRFGRADVTYLTGRVYQLIWLDREINSEVRDAEQYINDKIAAYTVPTRTSNAVGDSTISEYLAQNGVMFYVDSAFTENVNAVPNQNAAQQQATWVASATRGDPEWTVIQIGLNDLDPGVATATSIASIQTLVDVVLSSCVSPSRVLISQMTPCRARLMTVYGAINGPIAYQKWLDMNDAIAGNGATPITGVSGRVTAHVALLNDGAGNLAAAYDMGDGIHENNAGREIIANAWAAAVGALGTV